MNTLNQIIESKVEKFEKEFNKRHGEDKIELCLVPPISRQNKFWVTEIVTPDIIDFLTTALRDVALQAIEAVKVEEKIIPNSIEVNDEMFRDIAKAMYVIDQGHNSAVSLQATKAEEFINKKY